jgi:putative transposase
MSPNQAENSHQPTQLQRFVSIHDPIANLFRLPHQEMQSTNFREMRLPAMQTWRETAQEAEV